MAALLLALAAHAALAVEERAVEGVGAVAVKGAAQPPSGTPREAALRAAIGEAVRAVALELLPDLDPLVAEEAVDRALAPDPRELANRFRILEDRGERAAQLVLEPGAQTEYVIVVLAQVDVGRVRERLRRAGLLVAAPSDGAALQHLRIVIEDIDSYASYTAVRTLLDELGVRGAVPVEMQRGRAVLEVESKLAPGALLDSLVRSSPPELRIDPIESDLDSLTLRAHFVTPAGGPP